MSYSSEVLADSPLGFWRLNETSGTTAADSSGNSRDLTIPSGPNYNVSGPTSDGAAIEFDGDPQALTRTDENAFDALTSMTLEAWVYFDVLTGGTGDAKQMFMSKWDTGPDDGFYFARDGGNLRFTTGGSSRHNHDVAWSPSTTTWYHVVAVFDGPNDTKKIYVNGTQVGSTGTWTGTITANSSTLYAGNFSDNTWQLDGRLAELAIYNTALSEARIQAHYNAASHYSKTYSIDALLKANKINHSIDTKLSSRVAKTYSIDAKLIGRKTHSIDALVSGKLRYSLDTLLGTTYKTKTYSVDALKNKGYYLITYSIDTFLNKKAITKTYSIDVIRKTSGAANITHQVNSILFLSKNYITHSVASVIIDQTTNPILDVDLATALSADVVRPKLLLSRLIGRNSTLINTPIITSSNSGHSISNKKETLIDGYDRASMRWAFADSDTTTNGGYRIFPDLSKMEADVYQERQKRPWVTSSPTNSSGTFPSPIVFTITYNSPNVYNMVQIVSEKGGLGDAGIITSAQFEWSDNGSSWTNIGTFSGFDCVDPHRLQVYYYYDQDSLTNVWSTDRDAFFANSDGYALASVTHSYLRVTVNSISVNTGEVVANRPRYGQFYEVGCYMWDVGIQAMDVTSFSVDEQRDTSAQTLSPIGTSVANTFSLTGTLAGDTLPYYTDSISPYSNKHDQFQGATYFASFGVETAPGSNTYVDYGTFLADEMTISAPEGDINISGRDYSRLLQEEKMPEMVYRRKFLHYVIQDVVERAGIEKYAIDTTPYTLEELAVGVSPDFISDQEFSEIQKHNIIWTQDQTCWEFLQSIAYADLGVFYFDKNNVFRYKAKEDLQRGSNSADFSLTEEEDIISFGTSNEIMKNAFTVNYRVPERTKDAVGLWESSETVILSSTALAANVGADDTTIPVGAIVDWYKQGYIQIDNEIIHYRNRDDNNFLECERGFLGTTAASHNIDNTNSYWTYGGGTWVIAGGVLTATDTGNNGWNTTLTTSTVNASEGFNFNGIVTINSSPWAAAFIVRANNTSNHYRVIFRCAQLGTQYPGITAADNQPLYEIQQVDGGVATTLRDASFAKTRTRARMLSGVPTPIRVQVHDDEISLFVNNISVLSYTIKDVDKQISLPAKIGFAHRGTGPTTFEACWVATLPEDKEGQTTVFNDSFGAPIKEIRRFDITYAPYGGNEEDMNATPPCWGIRYHITDPNRFSVVSSRVGPFTATIYVRNDVDYKSILSGQLGGESGSLPESFYLNGYAVRNTLEVQHLDQEDAALIARYQRQELIADIPWVESKTHAQYLLNYLVDVYSKPVLLLDVEIAPNLLINLGNIVTLTSTGQVWFPSGGTQKFYVVGINTSFDEGGITQSLRLRSVT